MKSEFEPKIVGFLCNWCSYAGADAAGNQQKEIPANIKVIRVMCSGRMEPEWIFKAFQEGADGVFVLGCHLGDCHYRQGNYMTLRRIELTKKLLAQFGVDSRRLKLGWVSAAEGEKYMRFTQDITKDIHALGPFKNGREWGNNDE